MERIKKYSNILKEYYPKFIFLFQMGFIIYLFLGLATDIFFKQIYILFFKNSTL